MYLEKKPRTQALPDGEKSCQKGRQLWVKRQMFLVADRWVMKSTISLLKQILVYQHLGTASYGVVSLRALLSPAFCPPPLLWNSLS